jgi:small subunit ribosomal protein S2
MSIDLKQMLEAGVHFGHRTSRWSPKMKPFIWGAKNKIHLIDVSKTALLMERAGKFLKDITSTGGKVLFVGTKKAAQDIIVATAATTGMPFVINRWVGGTLSNYEQVKKAITRLLHMRDVVQKTTTQYKKKELSMIQKEIARLEKNVGGIINFDFPPAALVIVDAKKEESAIKEAMRMNIPVVALVDTNTDPSGVMHIIPANDDSPKSISFVMKFLEAQVLAGTSAFEAAKAKPAVKVEAKVVTAPAAPTVAAAPEAPAAAPVAAERPAKAAKKTDAGQ